MISQLVELRPLLPGEFSQWFLDHIEKYAIARARYSDETPLQARQTAIEQMDKKFPGRELAPFHFVFWIVDVQTQQKIGTLWYHKRPDSIYLYDIEISASSRRKGFGRAVMAQLEKIAAEAKVAKIELHVFASNVPARTLYQDLGYLETSVWMEKHIPG